MGLTPFHRNPWDWSSPCVQPTRARVHTSTMRKHASQFHRLTATALFTTRSHNRHHRFARAYRSRHHTSSASELIWTERLHRSYFVISSQAIRRLYLLPDPNLLRLHFLSMIIGELHHLLRSHSSQPNQAWRREHTSNRSTVQTQTNPNHKSAVRGRTILHSPETKAGDDGAVGISAFRSRKTKKEKPDGSSPFD